MEECVEQLYFHIRNEPFLLHNAQSCNSRPTIAPPAHTLLSARGCRSHNLFINRSPFLKHGSNRQQQTSRFVCGIGLEWRFQAVSWASAGNMAQHAEFAVVTPPEGAARVSRRRSASQCRSWVKADGSTDFAPEAGRYTLCVSCSLGTCVTRRLAKFPENSGHVHCKVTHNDCFAAMCHTHAHGPADVMLFFP